MPELRFINHYHDAAGYISALVTSIRDFWDVHGRGDRLLMSFHGLPRRTLVDGDPYHCQCQKTARLVAADLELDDDYWQISFQSRVGREEWLRPYTDDTLKKWGRDKMNKVDVICPGFAADCLETLEEIVMRDAAVFYHCQCQKTARHVAADLELDDDYWQISFQSRVGREEWLRPYTDDTLKKWGRDKMNKVDVICPGFAADCLETLEEIVMRDAASFATAGGGELRYIPALNARDDHIAFLSRTIEKNVAGWPEASPDWSPSEAARQMEKSLQRAHDMGAER